jgi:hypothetical protein
MTLSDLNRTYDLLGDEFKIHLKQTLPTPALKEFLRLNAESCKQRLYSINKSLSDAEFKQKYANIQHEEQTFLLFIQFIDEITVTDGA